MKRSKLSEVQIGFVLKQAEHGTTIGEVCRKVGISDPPFYTWGKKYAGPMLSEMRRLRQLEDEHANPIVLAVWGDGSSRFSDSSAIATVAPLQHQPRPRLESATRPLLGALRPAT